MLVMGIKFGMGFYLGMLIRSGALLGFVCLFTAAQDYFKSWRMKPLSEAYPAPEDCAPASEFPYETVIRSVVTWRDPSRSTGRRKEPQYWN